MLFDKNDDLTHQMPDRLKTTAMCLGLVRLLMDAGRTEEAKETLAFLENDFQGENGWEMPTAKRSNQLTGRVA
jgi:hypothetical protein